MSARSDRERAERAAAAHQRRMEDGVAAITASTNLTDAIAHALALYEATRPNLPTGGGYALHKWAIKPATFIVAALVEAGWTTAPKGTP